MSPLRPGAPTRGRAFWRSLEEAACAPDFAARLTREFPELSELADGTLDRRRFLQLMGASLALAGLTGCGPEQPPEDIVPYVVAPRDIVAGKPQLYATATTLGGYATGVLVRHESGRPFGIAGNPDHPASLGAIDAIGQAALLGLYDPDRAKLTTFHGRSADWSAAITALDERMALHRPRHGAGLRILTEAVGSPTLLAQLEALLAELPEARWHQWEPVDRDGVLAGSRLALGRTAEPIPQLDRAAVVLAIESDLLSSAPGALRHARDFAQRRNPDADPSMSRLYAIESTPTLTGAAADHRFVVAPQDIPGLLHGIWTRLQDPSQPTGDQEPPWLAPVVRDLVANHGTALVHIGPEQSAESHALVLAINDRLGALGQTLRFIEPVVAPAQHGLAELAADIAAGQVDSLLILGGNPAYSAPADLDFAAAIGRVPFSASLSLYADETAALCHWHIPQTHELEDWSDARAFDGTVTIQQPQVRPIFGGHAAHAVLAILAGDLRPDPAAILLGRWRDIAEQRGIGDGDRFWADSLRRGIVADSANPDLAVSLRPDFVPPAPPPASPPATGSSGRMTLLFRPDAGVWDGRFANNGWLQEMPRPLTKLTWDNAAMIAPARAAQLQLQNGDLVAITVGERRVHAPVWVLPGQHPDAVTMVLGFGRSRAGQVGTDVGVDAFAIRQSRTPWSEPGIALAKLGTRVTLATTQHHDTMAGRDLVRSGSLASYRQDPHFLHDKPPDGSLYPPFPAGGHGWAMAIDTGLCIGCNACVIACQAENNIPVVGRAEVLRGREMNWLRIDRYYHGDADAPETYFLPVPCMHCEQAPCEVVCPVEATMHDSDGLNVQVYNRCVGTRFCSNNCPYKVRRFNFFDYSGQEQRIPAGRNPDVSVRSRGVMEKCTYCIQRIREAEIEAGRERRPIRDGEVVTACQAACPAQAISFGDRNDPNSTVAQRKASPRDYTLLSELNTRPRTSYGARLRNLNPEIEES